MGKGLDCNFWHGFHRHNNSDNEFGTAMNKVVAYSIIITCVLISGALLTVFYMRFFQGNPPVEFYNLPFPTDKIEYLPGEPVRIDVDLCRIVGGITYTSHKRFVNSEVHSMPVDIRGGLEGPGCFRGWVHTTTVPADLPSGKYHIEGKSEYQINPIAVRSVPWKTTEFQVLGLASND